MKQTNNDLVWVDIETSGLDANKHEILEICLAYKPKDRDAWLFEEYKIKMERPEDADPKALEINGYTEEKWKDAGNKEKVLPLVLDKLKYDVFAGGQCVHFDMNFIKTQAELLGLNTKKMTRRYVDTSTLAYINCVPYGLRSVSLGNICDWLDIPHSKAHTARGDVESCIKVYDKLARCSELDRKYWKLKNKIKTFIKE